VHPASTPAVFAVERPCLTRITVAIRRAYRGSVSACVE